MKDYVYMVAVVLAFGAGAWLTSAHYDREIALMEAAQSDALRAAERKNAEGLSKATDTIILAQAWFADWLTLVQSAADSISDAPQTTTH